jgi:hypothetical protein
VTRLRNVAPFNALLLQVQKPGITYVASARDWFERFGRRIKDESRPLLILWPFGPVATVYDVQDTYDQNKPEQIGLPADIAAFFASGEMTEATFSRFPTLLACKSIDIVWTDHGDAKAGSIRVVQWGDKDRPTTYSMTLNQNHPVPTRFATLAHELGHLFLGHLGEDRNLGIRECRVANHGQREIEAESVAYVVCERNGVKPASHTYLSSFVNREIDASHLDLYRIMHAAGQIETILKLSRHTKFGPSREG